MVDETRMRTGSSSRQGVRKGNKGGKVVTIHIGEGVGDLLPRVRHDRVCGIHKLVEMKFVKKVVGLLSVSVENEGLFSLEGFFVS